MMLGSEQGSMPIDVLDADVPQAPEQTSSAWLLDVADGLAVAVAEQDVIYVFPELPAVFPIPQTSAHVLGVLTWQQYLVPVIDLAVYLGIKPAVSAADDLQVMVLLNLGDSRLGAIALEQIPERADVADSSQCELPANLRAWNALAPSCFMHKGRGAVPILDLNAVYGDDLKRTVLDENTSCG